MGAPSADSDGDGVFGEGYVVFGTEAGFTASLDLSNLDGSNGFRLLGSGSDVDGVGDVNGDGLDDIIIASDGSCHIVFGRDTGFYADLDLTALDGTDGFRLEGIDADGDRLSAADAGDVNGDGIADLIFGEVSVSSTPFGRSYVVFGSEAGFGESVDLRTLDGSNGFRVEGIDENDRSGFSVAGAGDFNGDGIDDLIIGAPWRTTLAGETYVVFGTGTGFKARFDLAALDGSNGFRLEGIAGSDSSGSSLGGAGDINGDGCDDLVIGAPGAGESYVVFGFRTEEPLKPIFGGPLRDVLAGTNASESFHPGGGRDFITTGGGNDTIFFDDRAGKRDVLTVEDFDPFADTLDLRGVSVAETIECETRTVLLLEGDDCDRVVLLGLSSSPLDLI